jgi:hypothetical protein
MLRPASRTLRPLALPAFALLFGLASSARADIRVSDDFRRATGCEGKAPGEPCMPPGGGPPGICARSVRRHGPTSGAIEPICAPAGDAERLEAEVKAYIEDRHRASSSCYAASVGAQGAALVVFLGAAGLAALGLARRAERRQGAPVARRLARSE